MLFSGFGNLKEQERKIRQFINFGSMEFNNNHFTTPMFLNIQNALSSYYYMQQFVHNTSPKVDFEPLLAGLAHFGLQIDRVVPDKGRIGLITKLAKGKKNNIPVKQGACMSQSEKHLNAGLNGHRE
jgi:hypothetical protein